jgi:hypothetical protein
MIGSDLARAAVCLVVWAVAVLACAGVSRPDNPSARRVALAIAFVALLVPLGFPAQWPLSRGTFTIFALAVFGRALDLALRPTALSFGARLWFLLALFDVRRAKRVAPRLDGAELRWLLGHAVAVAFASIGITLIAPALAGPARWWVRWSCGACFCYAYVEVLHSLLLIAYRLAGVALPRINDFPIRSATLVEFWGRRWNRVVAGWLRDYLFFPLARRGAPGAGVCLAFAASTALHFWLAFVALDLRGGLLMASFFVVQAVAILLERRLGVTRWPPGHRRAWAIAWLLASSPLFVEPALLIWFGPG